MTYMELAINCIDDCNYLKKLAWWFGGTIYTNYDPRFMIYNFYIYNDDIGYLHIPIPWEIVRVLSVEDLTKQITLEYIKELYSRL